MVSLDSDSKKKRKKEKEKLYSVCVLGMGLFTCSDSSVNVRGLLGELVFSCSAIL